MATLLAGAVLAANLAFAISVVPPRLLRGGEPIAQLDYALHFSRAAATDQFLTRSGRAWGYDPYFLAGYPTGTAFDINNKFVELFSSLLHRLGLPLPTAFNLFVFLAVLLPGPLLWLAARNFRLPAPQQAVAAGLGLAVWVLDPEVSKTWRIGVIASGVAMYSLPLSLSCLYRFLEDRQPRWYAAWLVSGAVLSLLHPLSFLMFYVPVGLYLVLRAGRTDRTLWAALVLFACALVAVNAFWIWPVLAHLRFRTQSGYHWIGDLTALRRDLLGARPFGLRLLITVVAAIGLFGWWHTGQRDRVRLLLVPILGLTALGYVGGELPFIRDLETYRANLIAAFLLAIPASAGVAEGFDRLRALSPNVRWRWAIVLLVLGVNLTGRNLERLVPYLRRNPGAYALRALGAEDMAVVRWLRAHADPSRRVMVEHWPLGALVPWYTGREVIGGPYPLVWLQHNFANFAALREAGVPDAIRLFGRTLPEVSLEQLRSYLEVYNVGWVVAFTDESVQAFGRATWLEPVAHVGRYRIYRNADPASSFLKGTGSVRGEYGALHVSNASPGELVLKYHWAPFLATDPPQEIAPHPVLDDPVPFIRLPANTVTSFVIYARGDRRETR